MTLMKSIAHPATSWKKTVDSKRPNSSIVIFYLSKYNHWQHLSFKSKPHDIVFFVNFQQNIYKLTFHIVSLCV